MPALEKSRRDWPAVLSLGFNIDRNGRRREPIRTNILTLGILLPGFAMWGLYRAVTTPTSVGLWVLAAALYLFTLFGVTLGNHRYWTHRGFEGQVPAAGSARRGERHVDGGRHPAMGHEPPRSPSLRRRGGQALRIRRTNTQRGGGSRAYSTVGLAMTEIAI